MFRGKTLSLLVLMGAGALMMWLAMSLRDANQVMQTLKDQVAELKKQLQESQGEVEKLQAQLRDSEANQRGLQRQLSESEAKVAELKAKVSKPTACAAQSVGTNLRAELAILSLSSFALILVVAAARRHSVQIRREAKLITELKAQNIDLARQNERLMLQHHNGANGKVKHPSTHYVEQRV